MKRDVFASSVAFAMAGLMAAEAVGNSGPYTVREGTEVDAATLDGWRAWRALACERCHGAQQEGLVGPSLVESLKHLSKDEFERILRDGRPDKGMPSFATSPTITKNLDGLYAYLKGRSDGAIQAGHLQALKK